MTQFHFTPESYLVLMRDAVRGYDVFEEETAAASGSGAGLILELGVGTGETSRRVLERHPEATLVGIDASPEMLDVAREMLPPARVSLRLGRLEEPLPEGPFDLVVSALAVHHLGAEGKVDLFARVAAVLAPRGRFVLADVVEPVNASYEVTPIDPQIDHPSALDDQLAWLELANLRPTVAWAQRDLVVIVSTPA